jgi:membrane protease YdiL (CAAX protease family)
MSTTSGANPSFGGLLRGPPAYRPRTPWQAGWGLLATAAIVGLSILGARLLAPVLGLGEIGTGAPGPGGGPPPAISAEILQVVAVWQALMVALTLLASSLFGGRVRDVLALRAAPAGWRAYAGAVLAMMVLQILLAGVQHGLLRHDMLTDLRQFIGLVRGADWPLTTAVVGIGAPLSEEFLFRGFLLGALAQTRLGFWGAALVSTLLWAGLHAGYSTIGLAEVFAIGLFLSWLLWRTGSLRVVIFCHALYNGLILLALRLVDVPAAP